MPGYSYAFISYQTADKADAGILRGLFLQAGIDAFLAHDDIEVSDEWRQRILAELARADVFVSLLSTSYLQSPWCIQESGIAAYRPELLVIPLSLDGTVPPGFLGNVQSARVVSGALDVRNIAPALTKRDVEKGLHSLITLVGNSSNYRSAESNFGYIMPHIERMTGDQGRRLLEVSATNDQVHHAGKCAKEYLPTVLGKFQDKIGIRERDLLITTCRRYGANI